MYLTGENRILQKVRKREMNIKFKDTSNISTVRGFRATNPDPLSSPLSLSPKFESDFYNKRPLKTNSMNLSFKGLFFKETSFNSVSKTIKKIEEQFGKSAAENLELKMGNAHLIEKSGLKKEGNKITFTEKTVTKRFLDILTYPITQMPLDLANSVLKLLKKIPGLKKSTTLDNLFNAKVLKSRRELLEHNSNVAAIQNCFEILNPEILDPKIFKDKTTKQVADIRKKAVEQLFNDGHKRFDRLISNYSTITERTMTRLISGAIPAFFLANDAYNLSIYMNDKKDLAQKDKKRRFNQEVTRIIMTAASTYGVLKLFAKKSNASAKMTTFLVGTVTLGSEIIGRMISGTPILPVGEKSAKYYAQKQGKLKSEKQEPKFEWVSDESFKGKKVKNKGAFAMFEGRGSVSEDYKKPPKKGSLTFTNMFKIIAALAAAGFGIEKLSKQPLVKKYLNELNTKYENLYMEDFKISNEEFNSMIKKLKVEGFEGLAKKYEQKLTKQTCNEINIGKQENKFRYMLIHKILTFPISFAWKTIMTPYNYMVKAPIEMCTNVIKKMMGNKFKEAKKTAEELAEELAEKLKKQAKKDNERVVNTFKYLQKIDKNENYKNLVNDSIVSSLDNVNKSSASNADLAGPLKTTMQAITSGFLIADNYNMVMIDSSGKDQETAEQKAKERTVQRAARLTYGAFIVTLFNSMFKRTYNASLIGSAGVTIGNTVLTESLERKSVGLPIGESTKEKINEIEKENLEADGFKGKYYRAMSLLTGKKSLAEMKQAKQKSNKS